MATEYQSDSIILSLTQLFIYDYYHYYCTEKKNVPLFFSTFLDLASILMFWFSLRT